MSARIVKLSLERESKFGFKKARKRKKADPEELGQLNLFSQPAPEAKVVRFNSFLSPFEEALIADEQNRAAAARDLYYKAIHANDSVADAYCNLGILETGEGNTTKAIDNFTKSLKHDPRHFEAHYNLANIYSDLGNYPLARTHYEIAIEIDPDFYNACYNLALIHAVNKHYKEAFHLLTRYKELAPEDEQSNADQLLHTLRISMTSER